MSLTVRELLGVVPKPRWKVVDVRIVLRSEPRPSKRRAIACRKWRLLNPDKVKRGGKTPLEQARVNWQRHKERHPVRVGVLSILTSRKRRAKVAAMEAA